MKKKLWTALLTVLTVLCLSLGLAACGDEEKQPAVDGEWTIERVYATAKELGFEGTLEELIEKFKGDAGKDGAPGADGVGIKRIYINEQDELVIELTEGGDVNLGAVRGKDGTNGKDGVGISSVYINEKGELVVKLTDNSEIVCGMVVGANGADGKDGETGAKGEAGVGVSTVEIDSEGNLTVTLTDGTQQKLGKVTGEKGDTGAQGPQGEKGDTGAQGQDGRGITNVEITADGRMVLYFSDNSTLDLGVVVGANGKDGAPGQNGAKGEQGIGIAGASVDEAGNLTLQLSDGSSISVGNVKGEKGDKGLNGSEIKSVQVRDGYLYIEIYNDIDSSTAELNCGMVKGDKGDKGDRGEQGPQGEKGDVGPQGEKGDTGVGIERVEFDENGDLRVYYTDSSQTTISVPRCNHVYETEWVTGKEPTCTSIGYNYRDCSKCGYRDYEFKEATGHTFGKGQVIRPVDCENDGLTIYVCETCGTTKAETTEAWGHEYDEDNLCTHCREPKPSECIEYELNFYDEGGHYYPEGYSYIVTGITADESDIVIPKIHQGLPVTILHSLSYEGPYLEIKHLVLPETLVSIEKNAFFGTDFTGDLYIPKNVRLIEEMAPEACWHLNSISVDPENRIFRSQGNCLIEKESGNLIAGCKNSIIPDDGSIKRIGSWAFYARNGRQEALRIPEGVISIGDYAFYECGAYTELVLPDGLITIGAGAFYHSGFSNVAIPNSVASIGDSAFENSECLTSVTIGSGVASIGEKAFAYCERLTSITFGNNVKEIGNTLFSGSFGLTNITIGSGVTEIGSTAFSECYILERIEVDEANTVYNSQDGILYNKAKTKFIHVPRAIKGDVTIPDGVTTFGDFTFNNSGLTSIIIPDSVTEIGDSAFSGCGSLTSVTIGNGVATIRSTMFSGCDRLMSVTIGNGVKEIERTAFFERSALERIEVDEANTVYSSQDGILYNKGKTEFIHIPMAIKGDVTIAHGVTEIGEEAFWSRHGLTSITIPDSVTTIGEQAFYGCNGLESVTIGSGVTSIGDYAFYGCSGLTSITIPDSVTSIGSQAFDLCGLTIVTIGSGMTSLGENVFGYSTPLTDVYYKGTAEAWNNISIGGDNSKLTNAKRYYFSDETPTAEQWQESENWWHYDPETSLPTPWEKKEP